MTKVKTGAALIAAALIKTAPKSLFRHTAIFSVALLAVIYSGSPLRAAGTTPNPAGFDILGMKLGMSSAEIEAAIKAHDPTFTIGIAKVATGRFLGIDKFVQFVIAKRQIPNAFPETIVVGFTMTQPGRAFYIGRSTHFAPGQQSLIDNTLQQLRDKYGQESPNNSMSGFYWLFDNAGKRPVQTAREMQETPYFCTHDVRYGINGQEVDLVLQPRLEFSSKCSVELHVELGSPSDNAHLVQGLSQQLVGDLIAIDDIRKASTEAKAEQERLLHQQEQKASGVKPPL